MKKKIKVIVKDKEIGIISDNFANYISLTDIARYKNPKEPKDVVKNWMRNRNTIEFLGLWEKIHNPNFKGVEFDSFKYESGSNSFVLSPSKWIIATNAIGIISKAGRYGGTYAHQDISLEFASWISAEFKILLLKEFQRLKYDEVNRNHLEWDLSRTLSKINYHIHTDAIKEHLIPRDITTYQIKFIYADEADLLNLALFGITAKQWRVQNHDKKGNIRDYATIEQLIVLSNLESFNSELIKHNITPRERLKRLNKIAIDQMKILIHNLSNKLVENKKKQKQLF